MRDWLRRKLPTEATLAAHPGLRWMGPLLRRPWLWQMTRRRVAAGVGIGVFFGFLIPVAQIAGAALLAVVLRANLPVAALSTLVSNPFTYAPIGLLAYQTGSALLGEPVQADATQALADLEQAPTAGGTDGQTGWLARVRGIAKPLFLGLAVFAVVGGTLAWGLVHLGWTAAVWLKRRRRRRSPRSP
jgi:hypothetical protein